VLALAAQDGQGGSGFAYDADGLEVLGLGPGLTVLMGLPPPTPSAMAFRMSTSTTNFEPTIFTTTPFMALSLSEVSWPLIFKAKKSGQNEIRWNFRSRTPNAAYPIVHSCASRPLSRSEIRFDSA
jgi:hypothetical protein